MSDHKLGVEHSVLLPSHGMSFLVFKYVHCILWKLA